MPHTEICGSKFAHNSPQLIAACHVLHRLCMPRHPPNALTSRLRVHTANARAETADAARPAHLRMPAPRSAARQSADDLDINLSLFSARHPALIDADRSTPQEPMHRTITASISKPIHNVKERKRPSPSLAGTRPDPKSSSPEKLVEPVGIEPTTSSLQS